MADYGMFDDEELRKAMLGVQPPPSSVLPDPFMASMTSGLPSAPQPSAIPTPQLMGMVPPPEMQPPPPPAPTPMPEPMAAKPGKQGKVKPLTNEQQYERATQTQAEAIRAQGQTEAERAHSEAMGTLQAVQDFKDKQEADMQFRAQKEAEIAQHRQGLEAEAADLAKQRPKPGQVFEGEGAAGMIAGAALAFLAGANANNKNGNVALDTIKKLVNDNIQSQLVGIENKKAALGEKRTLLQQEVLEGRDAFDARTKATALAYDTAIKGVQAEAARLGSPEAMQKAQQLIGQLEQQKVQTFEQWQEKKKELAISQQNANTSSGQLALGRQEHAERIREFNLTREDALNQRAGEADRLAKAGLPPGTKPEQIVPNAIEGHDIAATNKARADELYTTKAGAQQYIAANQRLMQLVYEHDPTLLAPDRAGKVGPIDFGNAIRSIAQTEEGRLLVEAAVTDIAVGYGKMNGQGAMGDEEAKRYYRKHVGSSPEDVVMQANPKLIAQNIHEAESKYSTAINDFLPDDQKGNYRWDNRKQAWTRATTEGTKQADDMLKLFQVKDQASAHEEAAAQAADEQARRAAQPWGWVPNGWHP